MQYPARPAAVPSAAGAVWSELSGERQAQVVALLVGLALHVMRREPATGAVWVAEEVRDGAGESDG